MKKIIARKFQEIKELSRMFFAMAEKDLENLVKEIKEDKCHEKRNLMKNRFWKYLSKGLITLLILVIFTNLCSGEKPPLPPVIAMISYLILLIYANYFLLVATYNVVIPGMAKDIARITKN